MADVFERARYLHCILKDLAPREIADNESLRDNAREFHGIWKTCIGADNEALRKLDIEPVLFYRTLLTTRRVMELIGAVKE